MTDERIREIVKEAEERYERLISAIVEVPDYTLENLPREKADAFTNRGLYEFTVYRKEFRGRLIFMCLKASDGETFFLERFRIYGKESPQGIERADDPTYLKGVGESVYLRIAPGSTILDIGCGTGKYLKVMNGSNITTLAMDMSKELIDQDRKSRDLKIVRFFPGDCLDLRFLKDKELDYLTGVNILNVLYPDMLGSLLEQGARAAKGGLFAFTLPARADLWADYSPDLMKPMNDKSEMATSEYLEVASNQTFLGQMRLFPFVRRLCREKGWSCRVFRFLDSSILDSAGFNKTLDAGYLKKGENSSLKLLEFPVRRVGHTKVPSTGSFLVCAVGYGLEVYFEDDSLPQVDKASYFAEETEFERLDIKSEINDSIKKWDLPFRTIQN